MKKDVVICFKDDEMLGVCGANIENGMLEISTDRWAVFSDMYGNVYMIDVETIKYIKVKPHGEVMKHAEKHD